MTRRRISLYFSPINIKEAMWLIVNFFIYLTGWRKRNTYHRDNFELNWPVKKIAGAVATPSARSGLYILLKALNIKNVAPHNFLNSFILNASEKLSKIFFRLFPMLAVFKGS